jgi:hypothetical protein
VTTRFARAVGSGGGGVRRTALFWPFTAGSPWNMPLGSGATFQSAGAPATADLLNTAYAPSLAMEEWSHPIYQAVTADPTVTVLEDLIIGGSSQRTFTMKIPVGAQPALPAGGDHHMHVVQPDGSLYEMWDFRWVDSTHAEAGYVVLTSVLSDGLQDGVRGYGGSAIGGLIRKHEIANRYIPHAIAMAPPSEYMLSGPVWPASREDSTGPQLYLGNIPMGTLAAIPPAVDINSLGLNPDGLALATALQDYGMYVVDSSDNFALYAEPGSITARVDAMWDDIPAIRAQMRVVTNNTSINVGGPGTRRRPLAPRLILGGGGAVGGGAPGGATPTVREALSNSAYSGTSSSTTVTTGSGTAVGDLLVAFCGMPFNDVGVTPTSLPGTPTGTAGTWTNRGSVNRQDSRPHLQIWTRPVTVGGAQTVTWDLSPATSDSSVQLIVYVLSGAGLSVVAASISIGLAATTSWPAPSVACAANDLLLCSWQPFYGLDPGGTSTPPTIPGSMSNAVTTPVVDDSVQRSAREVISSGTTTGTRTATGATTGRAYAAGSITLRATG